MALPKGRRLLVRDNSMGKRCARRHNVIGADDCMRESRPRANSCTTPHDRPPDACTGTTARALIDGRGANDGNVVFDNGSIPNDNRALQCGAAGNSRGGSNRLRIGIANAEASFNHILARAAIFGNRADIAPVRIPRVESEERGTRLLQCGKNILAEVVKLARGNVLEDLRRERVDPGVCELRLLRPLRRLS